MYRYICGQVPDTFSSLFTSYDYIHAHIYKNWWSLSYPFVKNVIGKTGKTR